MNKSFLDAFKASLDENLNISEVKSSNLSKKDAEKENTLSFNFEDLNKNNKELEEIKNENEDSKQKIKEKEFFHDHRKRTRERFTSGDPSSFLDYDIIEMILFFLIPRVDVKPLAKKIIDHFKSIKNLFSAKEKDLEKFIKNPERFIFFLKLSKEVVIRNYKQTINSETLLNSWNETIEYLKLKIANLEHEEFHILCFDTKYRLIQDFCLSSGTLDEVVVYRRNLVKKIIECNTKYVIVSHNHPSGSIEPSKEDIELTEELEKTLNSIEVKILDHIIVAKNNHETFSFKKNLLID